MQGWMNYWLMSASVSKPPELFVEWWAAHSGQRDPLMTEVAYRAIILFTNELNAIAAGKRMLDQSCGNAHEIALSRMMASFHSHVLSPVNKSWRIAGEQPVNFFVS